MPTMMERSIDGNYMTIASRILPLSDSSSTKCIYHSLSIKKIKQILKNHRANLKERKYCKGMKIG